LATPKEWIKFLLELDRHYIAQNLYKQLAELWGKPEADWNQDDELEFNKCDYQHIQGMIAAEKKTCKVKQHAWSPKYSSAVEHKNFWKIILTLKQHYKKPDGRTLAWVEAPGIPDKEQLTESQINLNF
jgi:predicted metal-dependent phosphoesterase TrpH